MKNPVTMKRPMLVLVTDPPTGSDPRAIDLRAYGPFDGQQEAEAFVYCNAATDLTDASAQGRVSYQELLMPWSDGHLEDQECAAAQPYVAATLRCIEAVGVDVDDQLANIMGPGFGEDLVSNVAEDVRSGGSR